MIGTGVSEAFTFVHHVEEMEKVAYRRYREIRLEYTDEEGRTAPLRFRLYAKKAGWTMDLAALEDLLDREGILNERSFNQTPCSSIHLGEAYSVIKDDILHHHAAHISRFSFNLYLKEIMKHTLSALHLYRTPSDRIAHAPGPR